MTRMYDEDELDFLDSTVSKVLVRVFNVCMSLDTLKFSAFCFFHYLQDRSTVCKIQWESLFIFSETACEIVPGWEADACIWLAKHYKYRLMQMETEILQRFSVLAV